MSTALAVMARYPEPGKVKTRLAATIGAELATALYRAFILDLHARFVAGPWALVWMYEPPDAPFEALVGAGTVCRPQRGAELGERMRNCFEVLLDGADSYDRVIMIGADVPHIDAAHIEEADRTLCDHDVVLGPSADGGYYLIALRQPHDIFSAIAMGTSSVLSQTVEAVKRAGLRHHLLPPSFDIDEEGDLIQLWQRLHQSGAPDLPHTRAILEKGDKPHFG